MSRAGRRAVISGMLAAVTALLIGGVVLVTRREAPPAASTDLERLGRYGEVPSFALTERSGRRVTRDDLRGLVWVTDCLAREGFRLGVADPRASEPLECREVSRLGPARAWASHGSQGLVMHSARMALVDRSGQIRAYHLATEPDSIARLRANLRRLLNAAPGRER